MFDQIANNTINNIMYNDAYCNFFSGITINENCSKLQRWIASSTKLDIKGLLKLLKPIRVVSELLQELEIADNVNIDFFNTFKQLQIGMFNSHFSFDFSFFLNQISVLMTCIIFFITLPIKAF